MRKYLLAATALCALAGAASASTITGQYSVQFDGSTQTGSFFEAPSDATIQPNLAEGGFTLITQSGPTFTTASFLQVNPAFCLACLGHSATTLTGTINITFSHLNVNGTSLGPATFAETGTYSATYDASGNNGVDSIDWAGAIAMTGFPLNQDGLAPLVATIALPGGNIYLTDGADWNVTTGIAASLAAAPVPGPIVGAGIPGLIAGCFALLGLAEHRRRRNSLA